MSEVSAFRILDAAWSMGIRAFDTAEAYGSSASRLGAWSDARCHGESLEIITKCSVDVPGESLQALKERAHNALLRFRRVGRVLLLTHGAVRGDQWSVFVAASAAHNALAGQSVYSADEVSAACELPDAARLQVPGNVLDDRAIRARGHSAVGLDVRSVYLQGVLLDDPKAADMRVPGSGAVALALRKFADALDTGLAPLLIASMLKVIQPGDRLVIGVDDESELAPLPAAFEIPDDTVREFQRNASVLADAPGLSTLLDPRSWPAPPA